MHLDTETRKHLMIDFLLWMLSKDLTWVKINPDRNDIIAFFNKDGLILGTGIIDDIQVSS